MSADLLKSDRWKFIISFIIFIFTVSLVMWWWVFALTQLNRLAEVLTPQKYQSLHRMIIWEGAVLVAAIFTGGCLLLFFMNREVSRNFRLRNFFTNFTHDLKTSLSRVRLTTEILAEKSQVPELHKILEEVNRLDLQLENSLWLARNDSKLIRARAVSLNSVIGFLRVGWPSLEIKLTNDAVVLADDQALKSVFRNLIQNAWLHGKAQKLTVRPVLEKNIWRIEIIDDGVGFKGNWTQLGSQLLKSDSQYGNGLGLYLTRDLLQQMKGQIRFHPVEQGFKVEVLLPAATDKGAV